MNKNLLLTNDMPLPFGQGPIGPSEWGCTAPPEAMRAAYVSRDHVDVMGIGFFEWNRRRYMTKPHPEYPGLWSVFDAPPKLTLI